MLGRVLLCTLSSLHYYSVWAQGECTDLRGRLIAHGLHYIPGPDTCTLCVCDNGMPKVCKAVLCSPPQDCRSFRVGHTCCEFICLDDVVKPAAEGSDASVRVAAAGAAALVLFAVALVVYRVRRQKRRRPTHTDDQRSVTSIGYISGSMGYMGGTCETALATWKPPGNYLPRGEAPPPYDEAVAQCRPETNNGRVAETAFHRAYVGGAGAGVAGAEAARGDDPHCAHGYANMPQMSGVSWYPVMVAGDPPAERDGPAALHYHIVNDDGSGYAGGPAAAGGRHLAAPFAHHHPPLHRTIPLVSGGGLVLGGSVGVGEGARRSFHRAAPRPAPAALPAAPTSMPRNLNLAHSSHHHHIARTTPSSSEIRLSSLNAQRERLLARSEEGNVGGSEGPGSGLGATPGASVGAAVGPTVGAAAPPNVTPARAPPHPAQTLPLTADKPSCVCSYAEGGPGGEEADDYRSECENCKSATSSRWSVSAEWEEGGEEGVTQTLQRRAPPAPAPAPAPATHTLPQPAHRHTRPLMGPPSNWENWFNTIPDSDSESEEE